MGYSLISRFRGALLGAAIGEMVGFHYHGRQQAGLPLSDTALECWGIRSPLTDSSPQAWGSKAIQVARDLIQNPAGQLKPQTFLSGEDPNRLEAMAIALLPLLLYRHDRPSAIAIDFKHVLPLVPDSTNEGTSSIHNLKSLAQAIAFVLKPAPALDQLIPCIQEELRAETRDPALERNLTQIQAWIRESKGLATVQSYASGKTFASSSAAFERVGEIPSDFRSTLIALYGFLSTPEDFRLSLLRTARLNYHPQITCTLVGALSGAYNGLIGIPSTRVRQLDTPLVSMPSHTPLNLFWNVDSSSALIEIADQLFKAWAGVYDPKIIPPTPTTITPLS